MIQLRRRFGTLIRLNSRSLPWAKLILVAGLSGCGNSDVSQAVKVYEVKGSVLLADSKPLTSGTVEFEPVKDTVYQASGEIGPDGSFSLKTPNSGDGAAPGEYRVKVVPDETIAPFVTKGKTKTRDLSKLPFARKYLDTDTSELTATIKPEVNHLEPFTLSKNSKGPSK